MMSRFDYKKPLRLIQFYYRILGCYPLHSSVIVATGFIYRILNISVFVLIMKIFLIVINPESSLNIVNQAISYLPFTLKIDINQIPLIFLLALTFIIILHFIVGKINLSWMLEVRRMLQIDGERLELHENLANRRNMCLDQLPAGYEATIKISEIMMFFFCVLIAIFYMKPLLGILVFVCIPAFVSYLVLKSRENVFSITKFRESRQKIGRLTEVEYLVPIKHSNDSFAMAKMNLILSDFFGGVLIVGIILIFLLYKDSNIISNLEALVLVFSIRFAFIYAKESSVVLGHLLQQRTLMADVTDIDLRALRESRITA